MNKYWFRKRQGLKSRDLGWGWTPVSWEGWVLVGLLLLLITISAALLIGTTHSTNAELSSVLLFLGTVLILVGAAIAISHNKTRP